MQTSGAAADPHATEAPRALEVIRTLIGFDTLRVYRVDHETAMCQPIAFRGTFLGRTDPDWAEFTFAENI